MTFEELKTKLNELLDEYEEGIEKEEGSSEEKEEEEEEEEGSED